MDIDGTVALAVSRSPYDMTRVGEDEPNTAVIAAVRAMHAAGYGVVFCSGRDASARAATEAWLAGKSGSPTSACTCVPSATPGRTRS